MFLNNPLRNFAFRLSLWYALIFALSTAALLALFYFLVANAFQRGWFKFSIDRTRAPRLRIGRYER